YCFSGIPSLLDRNLCDARKWTSVLFERRQVSNREDFRMPRNREVLLYLNAAGLVETRSNPFAGRRRSHTCRPNHNPAVNAFTASKDDALFVDVFDSIAQSNLDAPLVEPVPRGCGQIF